MHDILRIVIYLISFAASAFALSGLDFRKLMRQGSETRIQVLYILMSMALGYAVAQFVLGLSFTYFI